MKRVTPFSGTGFSLQASFLPAAHSTWARIQTAVHRTTCLCTHSHTRARAGEQTKTHQLPCAIKNHEDLLYFTHPQGVNNSLELRKGRGSWGRWRGGRWAAWLRAAHLRISARLCEVTRTIHDFISCISCSTSGCFKALNEILCRIWNIILNHCWDFHFSSFWDFIYYLFTAWHEPPSYWTNP